MTIKKNIGYLVTTAFLAIALVAMPLTAYAWNESTEGNSETENSSDVNGETSGQTIVEGWIGTFDNSVIDPNRPDPEADEAWINVKIPTTALFGSLSTDNKRIYSPTYHIYNYSARGVQVTPTGFTANPTEPAALSGMTLNLTFTEPTESSIALRNASNQFLGAGIPATQSVMLGAGSSSTPTIATFDMAGTLGPSFTYPTSSEGPITPTYHLVFAFETVTD